MEYIDQSGSFKCVASTNPGLSSGIHQPIQVFQVEYMNIIRRLVCNTCGLWIDLICHGLPVMHSNPVFGLNVTQLSDFRRFDKLFMLTRVST